MNGKICCYFCHFDFRDYFLYGSHSLLISLFSHTCTVDCWNTLFFSCGEYNCLWPLEFWLDFVFVTVLLLRQNTQCTQIKEGKVDFGSRSQRSLSVISWSQGSDLNITQNIMAEGHGGAKRLSSWQPGSGEREKEPEERYP